MATAPPIHGPKTFLHVRGTWSARDDRAPSAVWLGLLWLGMILGFGFDFSRFLHEHPPAPRILYVHAVVFTGWMLLLTAQVLLVLRDRIAWHRKLGWFLAGWAVLMVILGPWGAMASQAAMLNTPFSDPPFLSVNVANMVGFVAVLCCSIAQRKNPAAHKRLMILTTVAICDPGFARFSGYLWPHEPHSAIVWFFYIFYGNVLLVTLMAAWDWHRGRLIRSFVFAATGLIAAEATASALYFWSPWKGVTLSWVQLWAKHFA
ncbi:MAG TPA: hypothetical protein VK814_10880 [Acidobacteriaceae bacterium]|jgi:hypothetical protein|nr:hypothetical protein [Acidobacteriaceae bacterium]